MRVSSISQNSYRTPSVQKAKEVKNVSFGYKEEYLKLFNQGYNQIFSKTSPELNKTIFDKYFKGLAKCLNNFPKYMKRKEFDYTLEFTQFGDPHRLFVLGEEFNVKAGQCKNIVEGPEGVYLRLFNLGKYSLNFWDETKHEQVVLEYRDPTTNRFYGISKDIDTYGLAITRDKKRIELYDIGYKYPYKSMSEQGYKPQIYKEYYNRDGVDITKESKDESFWDWFKNL